MMDTKLEASPNSRRKMNFSTGRNDSLTVTKRHPDEERPSASPSTFSEVKAVAVNLESKSPRSHNRFGLQKQK